MQIAPILQIGRGVTALVGGGGKTTLMYTLAEELKENGRVIITTTTKIQLPPQYPTLLEPTEEEIEAAFASHRVLCVAAQSAEGKLCAPKLPFPVLARLADYVIDEADGAKRLPLKAHAPYEPVIPENAQRVVMVMGIDGIGKKISETCHRPALYAALAGVSQDEVVTGEIAARVVTKEGYGDRVYINKVESAADYDAACALVRSLKLPAVIGSLHMGVYSC